MRRSLSVEASRCVFISMELAIMFVISWIFNCQAVKCQCITFYDLSFKIVHAVTVCTVGGMVVSHESDVGQEK